MSELELKIIKMMESMYCAKYCGTLKVEYICETCDVDCFCAKENESTFIGYNLAIGLNNEYMPIYLTYFGTDELKFLKFVEKELRERRFHQVDYFTKYEIFND